MNYFIGEFIKAERKRQNLTQEQLCDGLCSPVTLSRIENQKQPPSRRLVNLILQRLGQSEDMIYMLLYSDDAEIEQMHEDIINRCIELEHASKSNYKAVQSDNNDAITKYKLKFREGDLISKQILEWGEFVNNKEKYSTEEQRRKVMEIIKMSCPHFDIDKLDNFCFTNDELMFIDFLAGVYQKEKNIKEVDKIMSSLYIYIKKREQLGQNKARLALIAYNYSVFLYSVKRFNEAEEVAEEGRKICISSGFCEILPDMLYILGKIKIKIGANSIGKNYLLQALNIYEAIEDYSRVEMVKEILNS